jgi:hypothetical protein
MLKSRILFQFPSLSLIGAFFLSDQCQHALLSAAALRPQNNPIKSVISSFTYFFKYPFFFTSLTSVSCVWSHLPC